MYIIFSSQASISYEFDSSPFSSVSGKCVKDLLESAWFWHQKALDFSPGESCEEVLWETLERAGVFTSSAACAKRRARGAEY